MHPEKIIHEQQNGAAIILTIHREKALNALNRSVFNDLENFFTDGYKFYENASGVILTGAGSKAFAAGADIKEFESLSGQEMTELSSRGQRIFDLIENFHLPVIAAVNGFALGGGCELAMACHMRVASENARFGQPEVNLGIVPGYGATQRLTQLIGKAKSLELTLTGDMIDAATAKQLGLANHVKSADELIPFCETIIKKISKKGPIAIQNSIRAINAYFDKNENGYTKESQLFGETADTADFREGAQAFVEKRKANFIGK